MIIVIYGENTFLSLARLRGMRDRFIEKFDTSGMNLVDFDDVKLSLGEVSQAIQTPPFLSEKRMVIVRDLFSYATRKADYSPWVDLIKKTPEDVITILFSRESQKKISKHGLYKMLSGANDFHAYPFPLLSRGELTSWAHEEIARLNLRIESRELEMVLSHVGADLWSLSNELRKIAGYASGGTVTGDTLSVLSASENEDQIFALMDAISQKKMKVAFDLLEMQRSNGAHDIQIFAMLARQIRLLLEVRSLIDENERISKQDIATALGMHPFVAQKTLIQACAFSSGQLQDIHQQLFEVDVASKIGGIDPRVALDRIFVEVGISA
jgi:DNA polymerase III subunit delta